MKKILLGTTTLIGVALLAGAASAETPKVTLGGFVDFQAGIMSDDFDSDHPGVGGATDSGRSHSFRNDTEISVKIDGKSDGGLGYGGEVWLEADVDSDANLSGSSDQDNQGINASKTFAYMEGNWGRVEGGSNVGPDATMKVDASTIARATGGIDGDWYYYANSATIFLAKPDLPMNFGVSGGNAGTAFGFLGDESQENLSKLTYYTPRWNGLQLGLSYAPSDQERGQKVSAATRVDNTAAITIGGNGDTITVSQADSIWQGGISWEGKFDQFGLAVAATGEAGNAEATTYEDLRAWTLGGKVSFMGFSLAGSYGDWGDSLRLNTANVDDNDYWTVGGAYEHGPFGVSVTYMKSNLEVSSTTDHEFDNFVVGVDYKMAPGFTPYLEASFYEQDAVTVTNDNDGSVFIAGTLLSF